MCQALSLLSAVNVIKGKIIDGCHHNPIISLGTSFTRQYICNHLFNVDVKPISMLIDKEGREMIP